jgi:hypothetical protein
MKGNGETEEGGWAPTQSVALGKALPIVNRKCMKNPHLQHVCKWGPMEARGRESCPVLVCCKELLERHLRSTATHSVVLRLWESDTPSDTTPNGYSGSGEPR